MGGSKLKGCRRSKPGDTGDGSRRSTPKGHVPGAAAARSALLALFVLVLGGCARGGVPTGPAGAAPPGSAVVAGTPPPSPPAPAASGDVLPGWLLIADDGNDRLLLVTPDKRVVWSFPGPGGPGPGQSFRGPDDAFFTADLREVVVNEEENQVVAAVDVAQRRIVWQYGQAGRAGGGPGLLNTPDDAYPLPDGRVSVADIRNCRIVFLDRQRGLVGQYGRTGVCVHQPPTAFASPNGDTSLPDGGMLVTEIGGRWGAHVDRLDARGRLLWDLDLHALVRYASDAQLTRDGNVLVSDYSRPGKVLIVTPGGRVVWEYGPDAGLGMLDHPSMAIELPNGNVALNDDRRHRVVVVDRAARRIVWQYGVTDQPGSGPGFLREPDGVDFVPADRTHRIPLPPRAARS
jgi:hypothetical protein